MKTSLRITMKCYPFLLDNSPAIKRIYSLKNGQQINNFLFAFLIECAYMVIFCNKLQT